MKSSDSYSSEEPKEKRKKCDERDEPNGEEEGDAMKEMNTKIIQMRNLVSAMEELIDIMKSG